MALDSAVELVQAVDALHAAALATELGPVTQQRPTLHTAIDTIKKDSTHVTPESETMRNQKMTAFCYLQETQEQRNTLKQNQISIKEIDTYARTRRGKSY